MKYRNGFVSNSSSTSFVLYGIRFKRDEDSEEKASQLARSTGLKVLYGDYNLYVGLTESGEVEHSRVGDMRDDETRLQFQERIRNALPESIRGEADWYSESWYNG